MRWRDRAGRFSTRPNPWQLDLIVKPAVTAAVAHLSQRATKAVADRTGRRLRSRRHKKQKKGNP